MESIKPQKTINYVRKFKRLMLEIFSNAILFHGRQNSVEEWKPQIFYKVFETL